ncbi:MAG TPA: hypothetical protein PKA16_07035 [Ottowia sp.]|uniref:hypothetical protein n=1 Tax=Ottowia sp. TaxID=1898956 RepID=UPI002B99AF38|nr:hypothetical protein [Ottowia sp.]HMN21130.1 hypothetical protein [Ottowia sp.]
MKPRLLHAALAGALLGLCQGAWAQLAPGSDPIVLGAQVNYLAMPTAAPQASGQLDGANAMPSWVQAKIARYEAKAFSDLEGGSGTVRTDKDVISVQKGNALERTCTTNVASNTITPTAGPSGRYGPGTGTEQIAVLRGDVVTICK